MKHRVKTAAPLGNDAPKTSTGAVLKNRDCINFDCPKRSRKFVEAQSFIQSYFKAPYNPKRRKYVCESCYEDAMSNYEDLCGKLMAKKPMFNQHSSRRPDQVFLDSSDEESDHSMTVNEDSEPLPATVRNMFLNEFDCALKSVMDRVDIGEQFTVHLRQKIDNNKKASDEIAEELLALEKLSNRMQCGIYQTGIYMLEQQPPIDLNTNQPPQLDGPSYPPIGEIYYPALDLSKLYYCVRKTLLAPWIPSKISELQKIGGVSRYPTC